MKKAKLKVFKSNLRARVRPLHEVERNTILKALDEVSWDIPLAGRLLGVSRGRIYRRLKAYGLRRSRRRKTAKGLRELTAKVKPWRGIEKREILRAVGEANGNKRLAASLLAIGQTTIYRKLGAYRLNSRFAQQKRVKHS